MSALHRFAGGLRALFRRRRSDEALDEELRAYLSAAIEDRVRAGATPADAAHAARREMGSLSAIRDHTRDVGWESRLEAAGRDLQYAVRTLRRAPAFTAVAVATLTAGIGANTAVFSVINAVMLRPLPVDRPDELVALAATYGGNVDPAFSYSAFRQFTDDGARLVDPMAATRADRVAIALDGITDTVMHKRVSGNYFTALGVQAALGRTLLGDDDHLPTGAPVAMISHAYWSTRFGRDPAAVGRVLRLHGTLLTVVGVIAPDFASESAGEAPDVWTPLTSLPSPAFVWSGHSTTWLRILARRRPGVSLAEAGAGLETIYSRIREEIAAGMERPEWRQAASDSRLRVAAATGGSPRLRDAFARPLRVLMALVVLVLVMACANVATLVLARSAVRRRELAVRAALGAGRARLVRHLMTEALLIASMGALGGLLLAFWGTSALAGVAARTALSISIDLSPDPRVLAFTIAVSAAAAVLFGLLPAVRSSRLDPLPSIKAGGSAGGWRRLPLGRTLVATQIAVAVVLLVIGGLFVRSLMQLNQVDTGFETDRVLIAQLTPLPPDQGVTAEQRRDVYRRLLAAAEAVPGVRAASVSFTGLFNEGTWGNAITVDGLAAPTAAPARTFANAVSHRYFDVVGLAVLRGRGFAATDDERAPGVAVVNEAFARRFFSGVDPVGRRVGLGAPAKQMLEIVGVVEDAKYVELREQDRPMLYVPFPQYDQSPRTMEVRTDRAPSAVAASLRRGLAAVDARIAVAAIVEFREQINASIATERLVARLSAGFGILALALATIGLYGVTAYVTAQRTGEIGIRMALGGDRRQVQWLVIRQILALVASGATLGLPVALLGARLVSDLLYQVGAADPLAVTAGLGMLLIAAAIAGYAPARRAAAVDPLVALRCE